MSRAPRLKRVFKSTSIQHRYRVPAGNAVCHLHQSAAIRREASRISDTKAASPAENVRRAVWLLPRNLTACLSLRWRWTSRLSISTPWRGLLAPVRGGRSARAFSYVRRSVASSLPSSRVPSAERISRLMIRRLGGPVDTDNLPFVRARLVEGVGPPMRSPSVVLSAARSRALVCAWRQDTAAGQKRSKRQCTRPASTSLFSSP